jgi:hypothetical protein
LRRIRLKQKGLVPPENNGARLGLRGSYVAPAADIFEKMGVLTLMVDIPGVKKEIRRRSIVYGKLKVILFGRRMVLLPGSDQIGEKG